MRYGNAVVVLAVLATLAGAGTARAHKLNVEYRVGTDGTVRVEGWYESGDVPRNAAVQVLRASGEVLAQGNLDEQGRYQFPVAAAEPLRVVVDTRDHRREVTIPAEALRALAAAVPTAAVAAAPPSEVPVARRASSIEARDVLAGLGFLLAAGAFLLSWRNHRQLQALLARKRDG